SSLPERQTAVVYAACTEFDFGKFDFWYNVSDYEQVCLCLFSWFYDRLFAVCFHTLHDSCYSATVSVYETFVANSSFASLHRCGFWFWRVHRLLCHNSQHTVPFEKGK